jgi:hypothetical protein
VPAVARCIFAFIRAWEPPCTLQVDYWKRSEETQLRKDAHVDVIDASPDETREDLILRTTLKNADVAVEKNMFPYDCPPGVEHWTLWSRSELSHVEVCSFVEGWAASPDCPRPVAEWNYEENKHRSFDVPHVHCFFRFRPPADEVTLGEGGGGGDLGRVTPDGGDGGGGRVVLSLVSDDDEGEKSGGGEGEGASFNNGRRRARETDDDDCGDDTQSDSKEQCDHQTGASAQQQLVKRLRLKEPPSRAAVEDNESPHAIELSPCSPHVDRSL